MEPTWQKSTNIVLYLIALLLFVPRDTEGNYYSKPCTKSCYLAFNILTLVASDGSMSSQSQLEKMGCEIAPCPSFLTRSRLIVFLLQDGLHYSAASHLQQRYVSLPWFEKHVNMYGHSAIFNCKDSKFTWNVIKSQNTAGRQKDLRPPLVCS